MQPFFSIIIPCYNHGAFLRRAIASIEKIQGISYEIIIVDDGSGDSNTIRELELLKSEGYIVIQQNNSGPSAARNNGIRSANGKYIVPLDADDILRSEYVTKAKEVFESNPQISIVYSDFQQFGDNKDINKYKEFCLQELLLTNCIGACAIYRKEAWEKVGGYDERLWKSLGWEDWDLWLNFAYHNLVFKYLSMIGYDYNYSNNSRERSFLKDKSKINNTIIYFEKKYEDFYSPDIIQKFLLHQVRLNPIGMIFKIIIATFYPKYYNKVVSKGKIRKYMF